MLVQLLGVGHSELVKPRKEVFLQEGSISFEKREKFMPCNYRKQRENIFIYVGIANRKERHLKIKMKLKVQTSSKKKGNK